MMSQVDEILCGCVITIVLLGVILEQGARWILERIVEAESGDQTIKGRQMVANVILNITRIAPLSARIHVPSDAEIWEL